MNNAQLIEVFSQYPKHPIHLVVTDLKFNRWLTLTADLPDISGRNWRTVRQNVLDGLYQTWLRYHAQDIETHL